MLTMTRTRRTIFIRTMTKITAIYRISNNKDKDSDNDKDDHSNEEEEAKLECLINFRTNTWISVI